MAETLAGHIRFQSLHSEPGMCGTLAECWQKAMAHLMVKERAFAPWCQLGAAVLQAPDDACTALHELTSVSMDASPTWRAHQRTCLMSFAPALATEAPASCLTSVGRMPAAKICLQCVAEMTEQQAGAAISCAENATSMT